MSTVPTALAGRSFADRLVDAARERPFAVDTLLALAVAFAGLVQVRVTHFDRTVGEDPSLLVVGLVAATIVWRRRFPVTASVTAAVLCAAAVLTVGGVGIELAALVMAYSAIVHGPRWIAPVAAAVLAIGAMLPTLSAAVHGQVVPTPVTVALTVAALLLGSCTWLAGALRRARLHAVEQLAERARLLAEGRRQEVRLELLAERARISREVHDVVGHSLSGIVAQADGGRYAAEREPARAVAVLADIAETGRDALAEIRALLSVLRDAPEGADDEASPPGPDDLPALVAQVRAGGLPVELTVTGTPGSLPAGAGLTAYRTVQEGLTNVLKHAGPSTPTRVGLAWGAIELTVEVADDGPRTDGRSRPPGAGHGLAGMRERAALHGGRAEAGPAPEGGFVVRARLPYAVAP